MKTKATKDMTVGSPSKQIFLFAIPFLIGFIFQDLYSMVDMIIVGRTMNPLAYAAVGSTGALATFACWSLQGLAIGFSVVTARYFGAGDGENMKKSFAVSIKWAAIISISMSIILAVLCRPLLVLLNTPENLIDYAYDYIFWIFVGLIATVFSSLFSNMIRALGDSRTPLIFMIIACLVNIILDVVFISGCGMGTTGAAIATVLAQSLTITLCIIYISKKLPELHFSLRHFRSDSYMDRAVLKMGISMGFLNMVLSVGSIIVQLVTNGFGDQYVTAKVTGTKLELFAAQPLTALGSAVSVFVSQNYGAKKYDRVLDGGRKTMRMAWVWCAVAPVITIFFGKMLIRLIAGDVDDTVINDAHTYCMITNVFTFVLAPLIIYKQILQAVGRTTWTMASGFTEIIGRAGVAVLVVVLVGLSAVTEPIGFIIICFSNPAAWALGYLTIIFDYLSMKKKFKKMISSKDAELVGELQ